MSYAFDDILSSDSARDRAVFVSDRTQQLLISALEAIEDRESWDNPDDSEWDEIDKAIGTAILEILEQMSTAAVDGKFARRGISTQSVSASTDTAVVWNDGDFVVGNASRIVPGAGKVVIHASALVNAAVATQLTLYIRKNGTTDIAGTTFTNTATSHRMSISAQDLLDDDDYLELIVRTNQASTIQISEQPIMRVTRWYNIP